MILTTACRKACLIIAALLSLASCNQVTDIPFEEVKNYFFRNNADISAIFKNAVQRSDIIHMMYFPDSSRFNGIRVIRHRIEEYDLKTQPVLDYYRVSGLLVSVDGSGEIAETNGRICQIINARLNR